jgi:hypothetical protein
MENRVLPTCFAVGFLIFHSRFPVFHSFGFWRDTPHSHNGEGNKGILPLHTSLLSLDRQPGATYTLAGLCGGIFGVDGTRGARKRLRT